MISELPLFAFTTFAGMSAGAYIASTVFPMEKERKTPWALDLMCLVLLGLGLICCLAHLAHPELFLNALANPRAGITQEAYFSIAFGVLLVIDLLLVWRKGAAPRALSIVCAVAALGLIAVMGMAYTGLAGTPAWHTWATVPLFVVGNLASGLALYALFAMDVYQKPVFLRTVLVVVALLAISMAFEAAHFISIGFSGVPFIASIVIVLVACAVPSLLGKKKEGAAIPVATFVLVLTGMCAARWAFYAASVI